MISTRLGPTAMFGLLTCVLIGDAHPNTAGGPRRTVPYKRESSGVGGTRHEVHHSRHHPTVQTLTDLQAHCQRREVPPAPAHRPQRPRCARTSTPPPSRRRASAVSSPTMPPSRQPSTAAPWEEAGAASKVFSQQKLLHPLDQLLKDPK